MGAGVVLEPRRSVPAKAGAAAGLLAGILSLALAVPIDLGIHGAHSAFAGQPQRAVMVIAVGFGILSVLPAALYLAYRRRATDPGRLSLLAVVTVAVLLTAIYFYWVSYYVAFPADILIWSEGDYVNDIIKFRSNYPIFSPQVNNDSFVYAPGGQLLTYFLASMAGKGTSIAAYRAIHVGYLVLAAILGALCAGKLLRLHDPEHAVANSKLWYALWVPLLLLIATNSVTSRFSQALHDDALTELVCVAAFYLLLSWLEHRRFRTLALMAILPAAGFFVKQSLAVWAGLYAVYFAALDRPRSLKRAVAYAAVAGTGVLAVFGACYAAWGQNFIYWAVRVLGSHGVDPLRAIQHALDVWPFLAIGVLGGAVLLRTGSERLAGPWLLSLVLMLLQCYTSGIAWMINHIAPAALISGIWFCAALAVVWPRIVDERRPTFDVAVRAGAAVVVAVLLFSGLGLVRIPAPPFTDDSYRYVRDIEKQFDGLPADRVLLDAGSWVYLPHNVVMKDRAPSIGERGWSETGDFSGILDRIRSKHYRKILVRNFHTPEFWYDAALWRTPSGIKQALLDNYVETGTIRPALRPPSERDHAEDYYLFSEVSILEPKPAAGPAAPTRAAENQTSPRRAGS